MTILAQDTFQRANQSGFGTASDGVNVWGSPTPNGFAVAAITANEGVLSNGFAADVQVVCGSLTASAINMLIRTASSETDNLNGLLWRYSSASGGNGYRCGFDSFFGANGFGIDKYVNGSRSNLASFNTSTAVNANDFWWIRLIHDASNVLSIRVWKDGTSEPGTWNYQATQSDFTSGNFGVSTFLRGSTTISYDSMTVTDNSALANLATLTRSTFKINAALATETRATWKIKAALASASRATFKIQNVLTTLVVTAQATFKIVITQGINWKTRDNTVTWKTRDNTIDWRTRG